MPTFSTVARPVSTASTYTQTIQSVVGYTLGTGVNEWSPNMMTAINIGETSNIYQWWGYTAMCDSTHTAGGSPYPYPLGDARNVNATKYYHSWWASYAAPGGTSTINGHSSYKLEFAITGWEDLPEYISPKGVECVVMMADTYGPPTFSSWPSFGVELVKENGQTAQKSITRPSQALVWEEKTTGGSTDIWFTTSVGLSSSDVRGPMRGKLVGRGVRGAGGPDNPTSTWSFIDELKFVLYFQTDWYYGIVGTTKGMQNKMNGISLSTVAGVNGMSREA